MIKLLFEWSIPWMYNKDITSMHQHVIMASDPYFVIQACPVCLHY